MTDKWRNVIGWGVYQRLKVREWIVYLLAVQKVYKEDTDDDEPASYTYSDYDAESNITQSSE